MRKIEIKQPIDVVFKATRNALKELKVKFTVDEKHKSISASKGVSIFSWGEEIQINFEGNKNKTTIKIESISSGQLFSWGKNDNNEEEIETSIRKQLKLQ